MTTTHMPTSPLRSVGRVVRACLTMLIVVFAMFGTATTAHAQEEGTSDASSGEPVTEVRGVLKTEDENGDDVFLEGVEFIVTNVDGEEVGRTTTDENGEWRIELPGAGTYFTLLNEETLDGVTLRNPDRNPLEFSVNSGDSRPNLFPLGERSSSDDNTIQIIQLTVDGIKLGLLIAMSAIGLSLIYGTTGLVNFAHGEMVTFGAFMAYLLHVRGIFGWAPGLILGAIFAFVMSGLAGGAFNQFVWKPLRNRGASLISALVVSIGFSILIRYVFQYIYGGRPGFYRDYRIQAKWDLGFFTVAPKDAFIIVFSVAVLVLIAVGLQKTRAGKAMRAVADNRDLAESSGIDVERVTRWVWVAGSALAGLGGVLFGVTESFGWDSGFRVLLLMFAGVTLGGLGTAYGALIGSLVIGVFIQVSTLVIPTDMKNVGALIALVVILLVRPQGLLGRPERIG